jgi:uncharacterized protein (TIGR03067 family)
MTTIVLFSVLALGAPALKEPLKKDNDIVGEWVVESSVWNGRPRPYQNRPMRMTFQADGTWVQYRGDPTSNPPAITLKYDAPEQFGPEALGIYRVEGDTLTLCYGRSSSETRPTEFASPEGAQLSLMVFKRVKPKDGGSRR